MGFKLYELSNNRQIFINPQNITTMQMQVKKSESAYADYEVGVFVNGAFISFGESYKGEETEKLIKIANEIISSIVEDCGGVNG